MYNEPAFPQERMLPDGSHEECEGLSVRDYFAAKAMQSLILDDEVHEQVKEANFGEDEWHEFVVFCSYKFADAMMKRRQK